MHNELLELIKKSDRILITSHISPDPDAVCSVLLFGDTLKGNFPDKEITLCLEEKPAKAINFLPGYELLKFRPIYEAIVELKPDSVILLDSLNYDRLSRNDGPKIRQYIKDNDVKTVIIDHHEPEGKEDVDLYVNNGCPATVQEIYDLFFNKLELKKPDGYGQITMLGLLTDTERFKYTNPRHRETFEIVSELIEAGVSIEDLDMRLNLYSIEQLKVFGELADNATDSQKGYTYSFISDEFADDWQKNQRSAEEFKNANEVFLNQFIRNVANNRWGFAVTPEILQENGWYSVSFRSVGDTMDVSVIARKLGGGGHKPAAGAKFQAKNSDEAIVKVTKTISETA